MRGLLVEDLFACFGRTDHVPVVPAQADLVQLAIFAGPGCDLLVWLGTELVGISEDGESGRSGCVMCSWWRMPFVAGVEDEGCEKAEE